MIPEIPTWLSLAVILGTLLVTTVASLAKSRRDRAAHFAAVPGDRADRTRSGRAPDRSDAVVGRTCRGAVVPLIHRAPVPARAGGGSPRTTAAPHPSTGSGPRAGAGHRP